MRSPGRFLTALLAAWACTWVAAGAQVPGPSAQYQLKAVFLYKFPQFVEWPPAAWQSASTVQLCVLRPNPFGAHLDGLVKGESLNGRPLTVREIGAADALTGCHLLFLGLSAPGADAVLKAAAERPVLTVGESPRFLDDGGIIALRMREGRVRFEVNITSARRAGLRISSQLLDVALAVREGRRP